MVYEVCEIGSDLFFIPHYSVFSGDYIDFIDIFVFDTKTYELAYDERTKLKIAERREECVKHTEINKYENNDIYLQDKVFKS